MSNYLRSADLYEEVSFERCHPVEAGWEYYCPAARYCAWETFDGNKTAFLADTGYSEYTWDYKQIGSAPDYSFFMGLGETARANLMQIGYDEDKHDCCNGHYFDYDWSDFDAADGYGEILTTLQLLGYDEDTWNNDGETPYDDSWWNELPTNVQDNAYDWLCYSEELWNEVELSSWPTNSTLPGMYDPNEEYSAQVSYETAETDAPTYAPSNAPTSAHSSVPSRDASDIPTITASDSPSLPPIRTLPPAAEMSDCLSSAISERIGSISRQFNLPIFGGDE